MSQAFHDFIRPGEEDLYAELDRSLRAELAPAGILETTLFEEIRNATWRLRRCGLVEALLATSGAEDLSETQEKVDRARRQAHRLLHKCTAELRKLQTDRQYRNASFPPEVDHSHSGIADWCVIRKGIDQQSRADYHRHKFTRMAVPDPSSFCKTQTQTGHATSVAS